MQLKTIEDKVLGELIFPEYDVLISGIIEYFGTWELREQKWISSNVFPGSVVYNLGANIGYHSIVSSKSQNQDGIVVAVEASSDLCKIIEKNCQNKKISNIEIFNFAITDKNDDLEIYYSEDNCGDNRVSNPNAGSRSEKIKSITINKLIEKVGEEPDIIIMDIQGWETHVLNTIMKTKKKIKCLFEFTPNFIIEMGFSVEKEIKNIIKSGWTIKNLDDNVVDLYDIYNQYLNDPNPKNFFLNLVAER